MPRSPPADTIIVGGGLAGLTAARALARQGFASVLLEGRARLGGRVHTAHDVGGTTPAELGAEWLGERGMVADLLAEAGCDVQEAAGAHANIGADGVVGGADRFGAIHRMVQRVANMPGPDSSLTNALDACAPAAGFAEDREALLSYVQGFHAARPELLSARWLADVETNQLAGESRHRSVQGLARAVQFLSGDIIARCDVRMNMAVREITWRRGHVAMLTDGGETFEARSAIVTVPLPMLSESNAQVAAVRCDPPLPDKQAAAALLHTGSVVKVVLRFREPFWEEAARLGGMLFLFAPSARFPTWWRVGDRASTTLVGWAGGPRAAALSHLSGSHVVDAALDSLANTLRRSRADVDQLLAAHHFHDWNADPFSAGAYTYVGVGGIDAHRTLAASVENTLFFAGEATCGGGLNATMEGAMQSGARAADEVAKALR